MPVISKKGIGHEREDKTMAMTAVVYPELPGEGRELEIPNNREDMFRFLCRMDDYEKWMTEELEELRAWKFRPGDCIPDNVLLSKLDQIGGSGNKGFSNPVYTAYIASIEDAKERNERIEKTREVLKRNLYKIAFVKILINRYLSKEERMAIEARVFCRKPYDYYWEKSGRKNVSRATFYRRANEGVDHLLMLLKRYYQDAG